MDTEMKFASQTAFTLVALSVVSSAYAADLAPAPRLYTKAPPPSPTFNWTGFYVGAHGGYGDGSGSSAIFDPAGLFNRACPINDSQSGWHHVAL
jgi:outer membrane immunogenic protein